MKPSMLTALAIVLSVLLIVRSYCDFKRALGLPTTHCATSCESAR